MGMAASQARYLALVARKSNCEYEGQQINQARTALSNQSANLFNQMLGLQVPIPPSTQDFTKTQYSYTDGLNASTIDSWQQLADNDENYNYVVTHHYYTNVYTGSQKKLSDPQVQFASSVPANALEYGTNVATIQQYKVEMDNRKADFEAKEAAYQALVKKSETLDTYDDRTSQVAIYNSIENADGSFTVNIQKSEEINDVKYLKYNNADGTETYYFDGVNYYTNPADPTTKVTDTSVIGTPTQDSTATYSKYDASDTTQSEALTKWNEMLIEDANPADLYFDATNNRFAFAKDLAALVGQSGGAQTTLPVYNISGENDSWKSINGLNAEILSAKNEMNAAKTLYDMAVTAYQSLSVPEYVGNSELTNLSELTEDQAAEIAQIIKTMTEENVDTNFDKYYNVSTGDYDGGIYSFKLNGKTYYTTYDDLAESAVTGNGINNIDGQIKLAYYNADYVSTKIEKTEKALVETDGNGRFTSIRLENDSITYTLNMETITDDAAYQDAMNQYNYENAKYDKMIQDINAKTSIIQREDQQLELRLKQLDTEQSALSTEIDAVSKVVKDNIEKSFKTFGG